MQNIILNRTVVSDHEGDDRKIQFGTSLCFCFLGFQTRNPKVKLSKSCSTLGTQFPKVTTFASTDRHSQEAGARRHPIFVSNSSLRSASSSSSPRTSFTRHWAQKAPHSHSTVWERALFLAAALSLPAYTDSVQSPFALTEPKPRGSSENSQSRRKYFCTTRTSERIPPR